MEGKSCLNCKHGRKFHTESPCRDCFGENLWEPRDEIYTRENVFRGIDPGAPEGDQTNVRLDWGERGPEIIRPARITPEDITSANQFSGTLAETARAMMKQITRLDYAIEGVRSKIRSIGLKFTDRDMSLNAIDLLVGQLNALRVDLFELEEEREAMMKGGEHGNT